MTFELWLLPFLTLPEEVTVGTWRLVPADELTDAHVEQPWMRDMALKVLAMYVPVDAVSAERWGCFVAPAGGPLGHPLPQDHMWRLRRAVRFGLLMGNPEAGGDEGRGNEAWTTDNAMLCGHPIVSEGGSVGAIETGSMVRTLCGGYSVGMRLPCSPDLVLPLLARDMDAGLAGACYKYLGEADAAARRFERALDWFALAWQNSSSLDANLRIVALKSGFETLLNSEQHLTLANKLWQLLESPNTPKRLRRWTAYGTKEKVEKDLTDLQWWFVQFAFLRNRIAHGAAPGTADYRHEGVSHVMKAEYTLRLALREHLCERGKGVYPCNKHDPARKKLLAEAAREIGPWLRLRLLSLLRSRAGV